MPLIHTTSVSLSPSFEVFEYADFGVSGSIRPTLWFLSSDSLSDKQSGSVEQLFVGIPLTCRTKVLVQSVRIKWEYHRNAIQDRISDEQGKNSNSDQY